MATLHEFKVGDKVYFGRRNGQKTAGTVVKVMRKNLKVRQDEARGQYRSYPVGTKWTVPPSLCTKTTGAVSAPTRLPLSVGQTVNFPGFSLTLRRQAPLQGVITKVNHSEGTYEVCHGHWIRDTKADDVTKAPKRDDATIISECLIIYAALSPENLTCDGEASRTHVRRRAAELNRALKALWKEAGRQITEGECLRAWDNQRNRASKRTA
jgi:hypothetical protein